MIACIPQFCFSQGSIVFRHVSFARVASDDRTGAGFAEIADAQVGRKQCFDMAVVKESVHAPAVARRIVALGVERQPGRARGRAHATVGAARTTAVIPRHEPVAGLGHEAVGLARGAAGAVIHAVTALPFRFFRALENRGCLKEWREQAKFESCARDAIGQLRWVVGGPPDFVGAGWGRVVRSVAARNAGGQAVRIVWCVRAQAVGSVHVVVVASIKAAGDADLLEITQAVGLASLGFCVGQRGQEQRGKNGNDGDDDQQFDEGEGASEAGGRRVEFHAAQSPPQPLYFVKYNGTPNSVLEQASKLRPSRFGREPALLLNLMVKLQRLASGLRETGAAAGLAAARGRDERLAKTGVHRLHQRPCAHIRHPHARGRLADAACVRNLVKQLDLAGAKGDVPSSPHANARLPYRVFAGHFFHRLDSGSLKDGRQFGERTRRREFCL